MVKVYQSVRLKGLPAIRAKIRMKQSSGKAPKAVLPEKKKDEQDKA